MRSKWSEFLNELIRGAGARSAGEGAMEIRVGGFRARTGALAAPRGARASPRGALLIRRVEVCAPTIGASPTGPALLPVIARVKTTTKTWTESN